MWATFVLSENCWLDLSSQTAIRDITLHKVPSFLYSTGFMFKVSGPFVSAVTFGTTLSLAESSWISVIRLDPNLDASASSSTFPCCQWRSTRLLRGSRVSQFNYVIWYPTVLVAWCAKADPSWMVLKLCFHRRPLSIDGVLRIFDTEKLHNSSAWRPSVFLILVFFADHDDYGFCMYYCMNIISSNLLRFDKWVQNGGVASPGFKKISQAVRVVIPLQWEFGSRGIVLTPCRQW